jgi:predicted RNA methylase
MTIEIRSRKIAWVLANLHIPIIYETERIRFYCPDKLSMWRADTLLTKEPETIHWIDRMQSGEILVDIGASTGIYSLYAAKRGVQVIAVEPDPAIYKILLRNCMENLWRGILPCRISGQEAGMIVDNADYIKIDTDGSELEILEKNEDLLNNVKSVMIEESPDAKESIGTFLSVHGFKCKSREASKMIKNSPYHDYRNAVWSRGQRQGE